MFNEPTTISLELTAGNGTVLLFVFLSVIICAYSSVLIMLHALRKAPSLKVSVTQSSAGGATVVIAARDEGECLASCLKSVLSQAGVSRVVLVDDHSTDDTLAQATALSAREPHLLVLSAPSLPDGWTGKSCALHFGAKQAGTDYILFTDADVKMAPGIVSAAISRMDSEKLDHLGGTFHLHCQSIAEEICAPVLTATSSVAMFGTARSLGSATGAFNMVRSAFYRKIGGHEPIRTRLVDDVCLARYAKANGARSSFVYLGNAVTVRLFKGFSGYCGVVARSGVTFVTFGKLTVLLCATGLMILAIVTAVTTPFFIVWVSWGGWQQQPTEWTALLFGAVAYMIGFACVLESRRYHDGRLGWGFLYPLPMVLMAWALASATISSSLGKKVLWRGREYERM